MVRAAALALALLLAWAPPATARVTSTAKVRYETESGPSRWYEMEVQFLTGNELNEAVGALGRYQLYKNYAVIFFAQGQAAVILLDNLSLGCGDKFSASCFPMFGNMRGADQDGKHWDICTQTFC